MSDQQNIDEEESFIILGTSPGTSLDIKCNGDVGDYKKNSRETVKCNGIENGCLDKAQIEDAMKELSLEGSLALKASFKLGDSPSPASLMVASTIITDDKSTEELQKHFGELIDENVVLKETLKHNNDSMKEQFMLIASCQEDMMKTQTLHREKFEETKELVERLRLENKKLKHDIASLLDTNTSTAVNGETGEAKDAAAAKSGPSSALEFVTSPDDETIDRLTAQLDLVEKQRRQVITDNEKLTWQKESLEHIVDATSKERDDLKEKLKNAECMLSAKVAEMSAQLSSMRNARDEMEKQLKCMNFGPEIEKRDAYIEQCNEKISRLHADLKTANLKILDLENVKLEFSKYKSDMSEAVRTHRETIHQLSNRLREASVAAEFHPVESSTSLEPASSPQRGTLAAHVKLYDRTLKHLATLLNKITTGLSDNLVESIVLLLSLHDLTLEKTTVDNFKAGLETVKQHMEAQHNDALTNVGQIKGALSIFEGIFRDYEEVVKKLTTAEQETKPTPNMEQLSSALVARGQELQQLEKEMNILKNQKEDTEILKAQLDLYKSDFEAERDSRSKMASEKDTLETDLRKTKKLNEELKQQLEEVRRLNPTVYKNATAAAARASAGTPRAPPSPANTDTGNRCMLSAKVAEMSAQLSSMRNARDEMEKQLKCMNFGPEIEKRDAYIEQCNEKISRLHADLKTANLKILDLENVKLEFSKYKSDMSEAVRTHRETIHQLSNRLREASVAAEFHPVESSTSLEPASSPQRGTLAAHVKLYDRTLKHLATLLNKITTGLSDNLVESIVLLLSLHDLTLEKTTVDNFKAGLETVKQHMEAQHNDALTNVGQIRGALSIFEGIFRDYEEVVKKLTTAEQETKPTPNMEQLSSALVARGQELQQLEKEMNILKNQKEDTEILKAQLDLYKSDFEAERDSRSKMASEKDTLETDLRKTKKLNEELKQQLEEVRRINPTVYKNATAAAARPSAGTPRAPPSPANTDTGNRVAKKKSIATATKTVQKEKEADDIPREKTPPPLRFDCPVCDRPYKTLVLLQQHIDTCIANT